MKNRLFLIIVGILFLLQGEVLLIQAQSPIEASTITNTTETAKDDYLNVTTSTAIDALVEAHIQHNRSRPQVKGYRVQVIQDNDRDEVQAERLKLITMYPTLQVYQTYEAPYFKLRVGDFENRFEAYSVFRQLKPQFKRSFIVPDQINKSRM